MQPTELIFCTRRKDRNSMRHRFQVVSLGIVTVLAAIGITWAAPQDTAYAQVDGASYGQGPGATGLPGVLGNRPSAPNGVPGVLANQPSTSAGPNGVQANQPAGQVVARALPNTGSGPATSDPDQGQIVLAAASLIVF